MCKNGECSGEVCVCANCKCETQRSTEAYKKVYDEKFGYTHPADADGVDKGPVAPEIETESGTVDNPNDGEQFPDN